MARIRLSGTSIHGKIQDASLSSPEKSISSLMTRLKSMRKISLTKGYSVIVDDADYEYLSQWKWHYNSGYAERKENGKHIRMHRQLCSGDIIDHIKGNTLDNRRENLRPATKSQNAMNMQKLGKYKGVSKSGNTFRTQIWKDNRKVFSASTSNERWSAMIYDLNAPLLFGEYARLNFPNALRGNDAPLVQLESA